MLTHSPTTTNDAPLYLLTHQPTHHKLASMCYFPLTHLNTRSLTNYSLNYSLKYLYPALGYLCTYSLTSYSLTYLYPAFEVLGVLQHSRVGRLLRVRGRVKIGIRARVRVGVLQHCDAAW